MNKFSAGVFSFFLTSKKERSLSGQDKNIIETYYLMKNHYSTSITHVI